VKIESNAVSQKEKENTTPFDFETGSLGFLL
jgi:hypothetical protein